jgi:hypothetical protein
MEKNRKPAKTKENTGTGTIASLNYPGNRGFDLKELSDHLDMIDDGFSSTYLAVEEYLCGKKE